VKEYHCAASLCRAGTGDHRPVRFQNASCIAEGKEHQTEDNLIDLVSDYKQGNATSVYAKSSIVRGTQS
jgi:hypothetical protein